MRLTLALQARELGDLAVDQDEGAAWRSHLRMHGTGRACQVEQASLIKNASLALDATLLAVARPRQ
jgi:hypothetical protein